ncbi:MAG: STAS-like domain-containing protein [Deltaproteobacteria bacterium]|nr:STAS-like domain-containing protein [Deltaproteobacteria bacterium]
MITIKLLPLVGSFAENKDIAKDVRLKQVVPALDGKKEVVLDFEGIDGATQSFIHALISDLVRKYDNGVLDKIYFKNCNKTVQKIINIVVDYIQEAG